METFNLKDDMKIFCVKAKSFPDGIKQAFGELIGKLSSAEGRTLFGISYREESGNIIYKAAVLESFDGEGQKLGCETFTIPKGDYLTERIQDWMKDESLIGVAFQKLTTAKFDYTFPCVEWYQDDDVLCMVRLG